jgi:hypothetical protein
MINAGLGARARERMRAAPPRDPTAPAVGRWSVISTRRGPSMCAPDIRTRGDQLSMWCFPVVACWQAILACLCLYRACFLIPSCAAHWYSCCPCMSVAAKNRVA